MAVQGKSNRTLAPVDIYRLAVNSLPRVLERYAVADQLRFVRVLVAIADMESTNQTCLRPDKITSSGWAWGLMQITSGTQKDIEKRMGWKAQSRDDKGGGARCNPQYAMDLGAAQLAWLLSRDSSWYNSIYRYNQGGYAKIKPMSYGNKYARAIEKLLQTIDFGSIERELSDIVYKLRGEFR